VWEEGLSFELGLWHAEGLALALAVLREAEDDRVALQVDEGPDHVVLAECGAVILELEVGG
jgi:hypothetical protein